MRSSIKWFKIESKRMLKLYKEDDISTTLQKVQHLVAKKAGFCSWKNLLDASEEERQIYIDSNRRTKPFLMSLEARMRNHVG